MQEIESQIKTALILENSRAAILSVIESMAEQYSTPTLPITLVRLELIELMMTSMQYGALERLHQKSLADD